MTAAFWDDKARHVAVVLPYRDRRVLMQLRDDKAGIAFPNRWGFFGGSAEDGETMDAAAAREMAEEIGYRFTPLAPIGWRRLDDTYHDNVIAHIFCCPLTIPVDALVLGEGADMALLSLEEVLTGRCHAPRLKAWFAVTPLAFIPETFRALHAFLDGAAAPQTGATKVGAVAS